jgi:hypothetical protein
MCVQFLFNDINVCLNSRRWFMMCLVYISLLVLVTLRVVRGDEKGSLESETVKYGHKSYGTRTRK